LKFWKIVRLSPGSGPFYFAVGVEKRRRLPEFTYGTKRHLSSSAINWSIVIPAIAAIIAALIALLSNIYATYITGTNQLALEKQRLRENLIVESVKKGDKKNKAIENLQFFLDAGFIDDPGGKILSLIKEKKSPVLPSSV
jgi:hypothetical protein